ncbi:MAG: aminodeoxychorismate synthase component I, partial [Desulfofustis sp.]
MVLKHMTLTDKQIGSLLAGLADEQDYVLLDTAMPDEMNCRSLLFVKPRARLRYVAGDERQKFLDETAHWLDKGCYLAGWLGYEFLHDVHGIAGQRNGVALADFGVYEEPLACDHCTGSSDFPLQPAMSPGTAQYRLGNVQPSMDEKSYCRAVERILDYIAAGDTYQVNYTFKLHFDFAGSVIGLYRDLRRSQPVSYGSFIKLGDQHILSFSPELFFRLDSGRIIARPMKGTMKRGRYRAEDQRIAEMLSQDVKNRSENVMIVDLLRNDLARLMDNTGGGTVSVDSLFDVERYRTVFQMTSTITAERFDKAAVRPAQILEAIFPCGSVTGAPKIRTMEIIEELETQPRGVYTGAIGYFAPNGDGVFNVPIRTVVIEENRGEMGIGSGIVADSTAQDEWRE